MTSGSEMPWLKSLFATISSFAFSMAGCGSQQSSISTDLPELNSETDAALFFPVLRHFEPDDIFAQTIVNLPISERLAVFACRRIPRPNGRIGVDYVLKRNLEYYGMSDSQLFDACYENFFKLKIQVNVIEKDDSQLFQLTCADGMVPAILGHASTRAKFREMVGVDDLTVLIMNRDIICVTARGSAFESGFGEVVRDQQQQIDVSELSPCILHWHADGRLEEMHLN